jgi:hypothetical protein
MITVGSAVSINIRGLPPGLRDTVPTDRGTVRQITRTLVFIVDVPGRRDPLPCDVCDIAPAMEDPNAD